MKSYRPSRKALYSLRLIMVIAAVVITYAFVHYLHNYTIIMWCLIILCWGAAAIFGLVLFPIFFKKTTYIITDTEIKKKTGIIFFSKQYLKLGSIQYISTIITPLSRFTALNFVIVNAWGGKILFLFLNRDEALELASRLGESVSGRV